MQRIKYTHEHEKSYARSILWGAAYLVFWLYCGLSVYAAKQANAELFQNLGALGVVSVVFWFAMHKRQSSEDALWEHILHTMTVGNYFKYVAYTPGLVVGGNEKEKEEITVQLVEQTQKLDKISRATDKALLTEACLLGLATIQWGFGVPLINFLEGY